MNPSEVEDKIYKYWTDNNCFHAERDTEKEPYTIVIPPSEYHGTASYGSRIGQHFAGYSYSLEENVRILHTVDSGN